jgi:hypothetical protein
VWLFKFAGRLSTYKDSCGWIEIHKAVDTLVLAESVHAGFFGSGRITSKGHKQGLESCEAITRLASFTDAAKLTDRQLRLYGSGMQSIHASSSSHISVKDRVAPGPIKLAMELTKLCNSRSGSESALSLIVE